MLSADAGALIQIGDYTYVNALTNLITVESLLFASLSLAIARSEPENWGERRWFWKFDGRAIAYIAAGALCAIAVAAIVAWWQIFVGPGFPTPGRADQVVVAGGIGLAVVVQPVLAVLLALGLRE